MGVSLSCYRVLLLFCLLCEVSSADTGEYSTQLQTSAYTEEFSVSTLSQQGRGLLQQVCGLSKSRSLCKL
jgi:hypothetical protein